MCDIEIIDERLDDLRIEEDEPEFSKAELIQSQVDDWRYISEFRHPEMLGAVA